MSKRGVLCASCALAVILAGCGDPTYQTRYIPRASELDFTEDYHELPWTPPAKGDIHYARVYGRSAHPMFPHELEVDVEFRDGRYHWTGDDSPANLGPVPMNIDMDTDAEP